jgi:outer membrane lipoprotein LolB
VNPSKLLFLKLFFALCLAGCVARQPAPEFETDFVLRGKVGVRDAEESYSAALLWQQGDGRFQIDVWGPLGQGRVQLKGDGDNLALVNGAGEVLRSGSPREVMVAELGWYLPLEVLPAWVLGAPDPRLAAEEQAYDAAGRLQSFEQLGWHVGYDRFEPVTAAEGARVLPHLITARRGAYRVRVAVSSWTL